MIGWAGPNGAGGQEWTLPKRYALFAGLVLVRPAAGRSLTPVLVGPDRDLRPAGAAARPATLLAATAVAVALLTVAVGTLVVGDRPSRLLSAVGDHLTGVPFLVLAGAGGGRRGWQGRYCRGPEMGVGPRYLRAAR